eukprot:6601821-Pyramimonas_sp.AAC.1
MISTTPIYYIITARALWGAGVYCGHALMPPRLTYTAHAPCLWSRPYININHLRATAIAQAYHCNESRCFIRASQLRSHIVSKIVYTSITPITNVGDWCTRLARWKPLTLRRRNMRGVKRGSRGGLEPPPSSSAPRCQYCDHTRARHGRATVSAKHWGNFEFSSSEFAS